MITKVVQPQIVHPALPDAVRLKDEEFLLCEGGQMICLTPESFGNLLDNKAALGVWITKAGRIIKYYRNVLPVPRPVNTDKH